MSDTQKGQVTLVTIVCCECSVPFGMLKEVHAQRNRDHKMFWCPNGHEQYFPRRRAKKENQGT